VIGSDQSLTPTHRKGGSVVITRFGQGGREAERVGMREGKGYRRRLCSELITHGAPWAHFRHRPPNRIINAGIHLRDQCSGAQHARHQLLNEHQRPRRVNFVRTDLDLGLVISHQCRLLAPDGLRVVAAAAQCRDLSITAGPLASHALAITHLVCTPGVIHLTRLAMQREGASSACRLRSVIVPIPI
jgi:hypothetical protein